MSEIHRKMLIKKCIDCFTEIKIRLNSKRLRCRSCSYKFKSTKGRVDVKCECCSAIISKRKSGLKNSKHEVYFCNRVCKEKSQSLAGNCEKIKPDHYGNSNGKHLWKILSKNAKECSSCKENKKYLLQIHHIDGNRENNIESNMEVVCGNCHIKRHLKLDIDGNWCYDTDFLTPRDLLKSLG